MSVNGSTRRRRTTSSASSSRAVKASNSFRTAAASMTHLSCPAMTGVVSPQATIGFLGPRGTFTEHALRSDPGLAGAQLRAMPSFVHVLGAVADGTLDYGFVAIENSI